MKKLIIYTIENCSGCSELKRCLNSLNVAYIELNAQDYLEYLVANNFYTAPVLEIDEQLYLFNGLESLTLLLTEHGFFS